MSAYNADKRKTNRLTRTEASLKRLLSKRHKKKNLSRDEDVITLDNAALLKFGLKINMFSVFFSSSQAAQTTDPEMMDLGTSETGSQDSCYGWKWLSSQPPFRRLIKKKKIDQINLSMFAFALAALVANLFPCTTPFLWDVRVKVLGTRFLAEASNNVF